MTSVIRIGRFLGRHGTGLLALAVLAVSSAMTLAPQPASAMTASSLYPYTTVAIANDIADKCNVQKWHVVQNEWISPAGAPQSTTANVAYNAPSVALQLNWITYRCRSQVPSTLSGRFLIDDTNPNITDLINTQGNLPYVGSATTGRMSGVAKLFSYTGPFTAARTITIDLITRGTVTKSTGFFCAVVGSEPQVSTSAANNFSPKPGFCVQATDRMSIKVNVGLPPPAFNLVATITGPSTLTPLAPGQIVTITPGARNTTTATSNPYTLTTIYTPSPARAIAGVPPPPKSEAALGSSASRTQAFTFTVPLNTSDGTQLCFQSTVSPSTPTAGSSDSSLQICYLVYKVYKPSVVGNGSDVHAGSGVCGAPATAGSIIGQGDSRGEYVVSAYGSVNTFGSNGSATSSAAKINGYTPQTLCRPNLAKVAQDYYAANPGGVLLRSYASASLDYMNTEALAISKDVIYFPGSVTITGGTVGRRLTIYSGGTVTIAGDIKLGSNPELRANQPSLGIIAANGINILGAATQVDAYMFSDGDINTCSAGNCANTLNVRGFLMAKSLLLHRWGPLN